MGFVSWDLNNFMSAACQKVCELSFRSAIGQQLVIHVQKQKLSSKSDQYHQKWWLWSEKSHLKSQTVKSCQIPDQMTCQVQDLKDPHQMTCHMPNLSLKSHQKMRNHINQIRDWHATWPKASLLGSTDWYSCPSPPLHSSPPPLPSPPPFLFFLQSQETRIPGLRECVGAIIPNPCTLNRTFAGT